MQISLIVARQMIILNVVRFHMNLSGITLITTCTNRKRESVPTELKASSLPTGPQSTVLKEWHSRISASVPVGPASRVYCGRGFSEASRAHSEISGDLWIISAGLGLISEKTNIPSYNITVTNSGSDSILKKLNGHQFIFSEWWRDLNLLNGTPNPISQLVRRNHDQLFVIGLSRSYAKLIECDLLQLRDIDLQRVRLIGLSLHPALDPVLHGLIMPYDERLDGLNHRTTGTRSDFSQRAMRHFATEVFENFLNEDLNAHIDLVNRSLSTAVLRKIPKRMSLSNDGIMQLIRNNWNYSNGSASKMLRVIRDKEGVACEQGRFRQLFSQVKQEVLS